MRGCKFNRTWPRRNRTISQMPEEMVIERTFTKKLRKLCKQTIQITKLATRPLWWKQTHHWIMTTAHLQAIDSKTDLIILMTTLVSQGLYTRTWHSTTRSNCTGRAIPPFKINGTCGLIMTGMSSSDQVNLIGSIQSYLTQMDLISMILSKVALELATCWPQFPQWPSSQNWSRTCSFLETS